MLPRLFILTLFLVFIPGIFAVDVSVDVKVGNSKTIMEYNFIFLENENYNSFSFEKPKDAKIIKIISSGLEEEVPYSVAGDYFIFRPESTRNETLNIILESNLISMEVFGKGTYSSYVNFNIPVDSLKYSISFDSKRLGDIIEVFPRDYTIKGNSLFWEVENVGSDLLFLVNFDSIGLTSEDISYYLLLGLMTLPILLFFLLFIFIKKSSNKKLIKTDLKKNKKEKNLDNSNDLEDDFQTDVNVMVSNDGTSLINSKEDIEGKFQDFINKFLTDNEKDVVKIIRNYEGISQFDILNHLPSLTKSNLSKIISKLDSKHILKRIKVGKVNKIYLGEKLNFASEIKNND